MSLPTPKARRPVHDIWLWLERQPMSKFSYGILTAATIAAAIVPAFPQQPAAPKEATPSATAGAYLSIQNPGNGATVTSPFKVQLALNNSAAPPGIDKDNPGRHALVIDKPLGDQDMRRPLKADAQHILFRKDQIAALITLPPGPHTLQFVLADASDVPFRPPVQSQAITMTVGDPGVSTTAPDTGGKEAADARAAEQARMATEAKQAADAKLAQEAKAAQAAKEAADAKQAQEAKAAQAANEAAEAKQAQEAKAAQAAKEATEAKQAQGARAAQAAKEATEARQAQEAKAAQAAREVLEASQAEAARARAAEQALAAKEAEQALAALDARKALEEAKQARDAQRALEARLAKEEEDSRLALAKQAREARLASEARQAEDSKRAKAARTATADRGVKHAKARRARSARVHLNGAHQKMAHLDMLQMPMVLHPDFEEIRDRKSVV